jgi:type I restriction enzyme, S subunit
MHEEKRSFIGQPADWPMVRLGDITSRVDARNRARIQTVLTISAEHGLVNQTEFFNRRVASEDISNYFLLERGDFAYNKSYSRGYPFGAFRRLERYPQGVVSPLYICFRPRSEQADSDFLAQYLNAGILDDGLGLVAKEGIRNHGLLNVGVQDFFRLAFRLPSIPEQRQIAAILNTVDDAIRKTEQLIAKLKQVKQALLHDLLTRGIDDNGELRDPERHPEQFKDSPLGRLPKAWEVRTAHDVCAAVIDCKNRTPPVTSEGHPVIRTPNIRDGEFVTDGLVYTDRLSYQIWTQRGKPRSGDVLITREAPVGEACLLPEWLPPACLGQRMMMFRPAPHLLNSQFLVAAIMSHAVQGVLIDWAGGSTVGHVRVGDIRRLPIPVPPLHEQVQVATVWVRIRTEYRAEEATLDKLQVLKSGLMEDLLTGRVRVTKLLEPAGA